MCLSARDAERVCLIFHSVLEEGESSMERDGAMEGAAARCLWQEGGEGGREEGYRDNFLSALIALTVCRLLPSRRSLIEITCT